MLNGARKRPIPKVLSAACRQRAGEVVDNVSSAGYDLNQLLGARPRRRLPIAR